MTSFLKKYKTILKAEIKASSLIAAFFLCLILFIFALSFLGLETKDSRMIKHTTLIELVSVVGIVVVAYLILHLHAHLIILYHGIKFTLKKIPFLLLNADDKLILPEQRKYVAIIWRFTTSSFGYTRCHPWVAFVPDSSAEISISKLPFLGALVLALLLSFTFLIFDTGTLLFFLSCCFCFLYFVGYLLQLLSTLQSFKNQWLGHGAKDTKWPFKISH
jgi:hypothetical protein